ncbi:MAG: sigma factor-like helix-turn-helix DNA-binding protein [Nocardioidaceae bacterium]
MKVTARATRSGGWWAVEVPEINGVFTQARRLGLIPCMVADAVSVMENVPAEQVEVEVVPVLADCEREKVESAKRLARAAQEAEERAALASREIVVELRDQGLTVRDVGTVMGVSASRVSQLARSRKTAAN